MCEKRGDNKNTDITVLSKSAKKTKLVITQVCMFCSTLLHKDVADKLDCTNLKEEHLWDCFCH